MLKSGLQYSKAETNLAIDFNSSILKILFILNEG